MNVSHHELYRGLKRLSAYPLAQQKALYNRLAFHCYLKGQRIPPHITALFEEIAAGCPSFRFNPNHDDLGRFTFGPDGGVTPVSDTPSTFSRPAGVPDDWIATPTDTPGGLQFTDPKNSGNYVRVMPGDPNSRYPNSRSPYARWQLNGQALDATGELLPTAKLPEAHIPLDEFEIPLEFFDLP